MSARVLPKINNPHFLPLCRTYLMFMGSPVVTDAPADCQILFLKVDVLPCQSCNFPKPETCERGYLYGQDGIFTSFAKLCNQLWHCLNDSGLTLPLSVAVSSTNKSILSFLYLMTTYCMGLNIMYCFVNTAKRYDCCNTAENDLHSLWNILLEIKSSIVPPKDTISMNCRKCPEVTIFSFHLLTGCCFMRLIT